MESMTDIILEILKTIGPQVGAATIVTALVLLAILTAFRRPIWAFLTGAPAPALPPLKPVRTLVVVLAIGISIGSVNLLARVAFPAHAVCQSSSGGEVDWYGPKAGGQGAVAAPTLSVVLKACETMMLTGRSVTAPDGRHCEGSVTKICVLLWRATRDQTVRVVGLEPRHSWYGITDAPEAAALASHVLDFWSEVNCETGRGCDSAEVLQYLDEEAQPLYVLVRDPFAARAPGSQRGNPM